MKRAREILGILALAVIYFFAVLAVNKPSHQNTQNAPSSQQERFFSAVSGNLLYHTFQSENFLSNPPYSNERSPFPVFFDLIHAREQLYETLYIQYYKRSKSLLIHHRKTDILFPFHYFW